MSFYYQHRGIRHDVGFNARHVLVDHVTGELLTSANSRGELAAVRDTLGLVGFATVVKSDTDPHPTSTQPRVADYLRRVIAEDSRKHTLTR